MKPKDLRDEFVLSALPHAFAYCVAHDKPGLIYEDDRGNTITFAQGIANIAGEIADAIMAERLKVDETAEEPQAEPWEAAHGYQEAFYKIAEILGIGSMPTTPAQTFASVIVPKLRELMAEREKG